MSIKLILSLFLIFLISCEIPKDIEEKGKDSMINPQRPYSDFQTYAEYYKKEYGKELVHPLSQTILRISSKTEKNPEYIDYIYKVSKYIEYFADYGMCFPEEIAEGKCCASFLPSTRMDQTSSSGWTLVDYGRSDWKDCKGVFTNKQNHFAIWKNDIFKKVVITYPGTKGGFIQGMAELINSGLTEFPIQKYDKNIRLVKYFGLRAQAIMEKVFTEQNIINMKIREGYRIIFTGHSLGGAMGSGTLLFALDRDIISRNVNHPVLITFGQPRTGNDEFCLTLQREAEIIYRHTNTEDPIPQIPLVKNGLRHTMGRIIISGDKSSFHIDTEEYNYDTDSIDSNQEMNVAEILGKIISKMDRHTYYYTMRIGEFCLNHN